jgi:hypothetical protein
MRAINYQVRDANNNIRTCAYMPTEKAAEAWYACEYKSFFIYRLLTSADTDAFVDHNEVFDSMTRAFECLVTMYLDKDGKIIYPYEARYNIKAVKRNR